MDAKSIRFPLSVGTWRCDLECCGHIFCLSVSTAFINTGQGRGGFYSSLLWQTDALSLCFLIWNFPVEERRKLLLRALYSSLKQVVLFFNLQKVFCQTLLSWSFSVEERDEVQTHHSSLPPCSEHSFSPPCSPSPPTRAEICAGPLHSSFLFRKDCF